VAPGFVDTSGATAGQNIITGTYQDASIPLMQDLSRPNFPIVPMTWYDSIMVWTPTEVKFYMRPWSMDGSTPWTLCGTNTQYIGTGVPVYVTRASKCYGDTVSRSLFLDLEELYIDMGTPKRYLGQDLINLYAFSRTAPRKRGPFGAVERKPQGKVSVWGHSRKYA